MKKVLVVIFLFLIPATVQGEKRCKINIVKKTNCEIFNKETGEIIGVVPDMGSCMVYQCVS